MNGRCLIGAAAIAALIGIPATAADLHVPSHFSTIQAAIDAASPGDTVIVADGTYTGAGNRDISFNGKSITVRSANGAKTTIIQAQGTPAAPARGFMFTSGEGANAILQGFTITGGATLPGAIDDQFNGGGILLNNNSSPTIMDCVITGNQCGCWGAAICATNAHPTIINCEVTNNAADDDGGGIFAWNSSQVTIINSLFSGNEATTFGGGLVISGGESLIVNSTIVGNSASFASGISAWNATIINSVIWGNDGDNLSANPSSATVLYSNVQGGFEGQGNMDVDPMFVDPANGDYHLSTGSPLIDAGQGAGPGAETDMDGDPRLIGARVDIGADEHRRVADFNADNVVDVTDMVQLFVAWGPCLSGDCIEDVNGDQTIGVDDLVELFLDWG